jgi:RNA polymerase sigma factor (sigma-70 family)
MSQAPTTPDYIAAILQGDSTLLRQMYRAFFPMVKKLVGDLGGTEEDAKDVFQDAVMIVYEKARRPDFQLTSQFSTYFYGVCRNVWLNHLQKKSSSEVTIPADAKYMPDELPDSDFEEAERRKLFDKAFAQLGEDCQKLLLLSFQNKDLSMKEIAKQMGYGSEGYTRRRKSQCKERLVELAKSQSGYNELRNN